MAEHLTKEEIELLSNRKLRGEGIINALQHIETCKECRSKIKLPTSKEILKRLEPETDLHKKSKISNSE